jgi:hypothetical protein
MSVVTNKIIGSKANTLTLEMYCGLHFQFRRAHITREIPCIAVSSKITKSLARVAEDYFLNSPVSQS